MIFKKKRVYKMTPHKVVATFGLIPSAGIEGQVYQTESYSVTYPTRLSGRYLDTGTKWVYID